MAKEEAKDLETPVETVVEETPAVEEEKFANTYSILIYLIELLTQISDILAKPRLPLSQKRKLAQSQLLVAASSAAAKTTAKLSRKLKRKPIASLTLLSSPLRLAQ